MFQVVQILLTVLRDRSQRPFPHDGGCGGSATFWAFKASFAARSSCSEEPSFYLTVLEKGWVFPNGLMTYLKLFS